MVMPASRTLRAISFGVFCRSAPSTRAIIRSRNEEPGAAVIRTIEPVRDHGRAAGDGGAVAAGLADDRRGLAGDGGLVDRGDAFHHLAVARDQVAGLDQHEIADVKIERRARWHAAPCVRGRRDAWRRSASRAWRRVSACARPRPSATASAKLAKITVNQSQAAICPVKKAERRREIADEENGHQKRPPPPSRR